MNASDAPISPRLPRWPHPHLRNQGEARPVRAIERGNGQPGGAAPIRVQQPPKRRECSSGGGAREQRASHGAVHCSLCKVAAARQVHVTGKVRPQAAARGPLVHCEKVVGGRAVRAHGSPCQHSLSGHVQDVGLPKARHIVAALCKVLIARGRAGACHNGKGAAKIVGAPVEVHTPVRLHGEDGEVVRAPHNAIAIYLPLDRIPRVCDGKVGPPVDARLWAIGKVVCPSSPIRNIARG